MIDRDRVVAEVAARHGVRISPDDPLLTWLAVHDVVLDVYVEKWHEVVASAEHGADQRKAALDAELRAGTERREARAQRAAKEAGREAAAGAVEALTAATDTFEKAAKATSDSLTKLVKGARVAAAVAIACPVAAVAAIVLWLIATG